MFSFLFKRGFILPVVVVGVVPIVIATSRQEWSNINVWSILAAVPLLAIGGYLVVATNRLFDQYGGSLAPWNPPTQMVAHGPYQYIRNPMIAGGFAILLAEAVILRSWAVGVWFLAFVIGQNIYIRYEEEPALRVRFGDSYVRYCEQVPRWIPHWPLRKATDHS